MMPNMGSWTVILPLVCAVVCMDPSQVQSVHVIRRDVFSSQESTLDMALIAYDDQYKGCGKVMEAEIPQLFQLEYKTNKDFASAWDTAKEEWEDRKRYTVKPPGFKDEYAIAILAYTINGPLHKVFNAAVREAGRSREYYLRNFKFKALHYFLTNALRVLDEYDTPKCHIVYRGIKGVRFKSVGQRPIRFGQFTSSSLNSENALQFGKDTIFTIETCYGVSVRNFSFFPEEEEVLIPPFEKFKVTNFTKDNDKNIIRLQSMEKSSNYNCEFAKEKQCKSLKCLFDSAPSSRNLSSALQTVLFLWWFVVVVNTFG
ncbi:GPI-linked NAD(P)(+)--arginine ADP-ribosyltransferase 1-like [Lissotriton helveticus]